MSASTDDRAWADAACEWLRWFAQHRLNSRLMDERRMLSPLPVLEFGNKGLMAMEVDPAHGGLGLGTKAALTVFEQLGAIDLTLATFLVNNNCLGIRPFQRSARGARKDDILPELAAGREMISFALSEPAAGSNPMALETVAQRVGGGWQLHGQKMWIGNAAWAKHLNVFCRVEEGGRRDAELTGFTVSQGADGIFLGEELLTMGMRAMVQNTIRFENVALAEDDLLGRRGEGMAIANDAMMHTRLAFGAAFLGAMRRCVQIAAGYAARRKVSTGLLIDNPITIERLAAAHARIELVDALLEFLCAAMSDPAGVSDDFFVVCKVASSEFLWQVVDDAVQICGGRGYLDNNVLARFMRDARVSRIYEGPSETLLHYMGMRGLKGSPALGQALSQRCGAEDLAKLLTDVSQQFLQRLPALKDAMGDAAHDWTAHRMGQAMTWIILMAVHRHARPSDPAGVRDWANAQLDRLLIEALSERRGQICDGAQMLDRVGGYARRVGLLHETLPGEACSVDPLMRP